MSFPLEDGACFWSIRVAWIALTRWMRSLDQRLWLDIRSHFEFLIFTIYAAWGLSGAAATLVGPKNLGSTTAERAEDCCFGLPHDIRWFSMLRWLEIYLLFASSLAGQFFTRYRRVQACSNRDCRWSLAVTYFLPIGMVLNSGILMAQEDTKIARVDNIGVLFGLMEIHWLDLLVLHLSWNI